MKGLFNFLTSLYSPKNYTQVRRKLAFFLFFELWFATFFLRGLPPIGALFSTVEQAGPVEAIASLLPAIAKLNLTGLILAIFATTVCYAITFHDRISDLLGIRKKFDYQHILLPLAKLVKVKLSAAQKKRIQEKQDSVTRKVFYQFASSRAKNPIVDKHDIERALEAWSWFWILVEAIPFSVVFAIVAFVAKGTTLAFIFIAIASALFAAAWLSARRLPRFARPEIEAIAHDANSCRAVMKVFSEI
jgi:hypothetical protein